MLKRLLLLSFMSLFSNSAFAIEIAKTIWHCPNCGDPYTEAGLQSYAQKAHNLAFGASKMGIHIYNGKTGNVGPSRWSGLKISNGNGQVVEVDFLPSWSQILRMQLGMADGETLTFRMELPTHNQLRFPKIKYRPGKDYVIETPPSMADIDRVLHSAEAYFMSNDYDYSISLPNGYDLRGIPIIFTDGSRLCRSYDCF